MKKLLFLLCLFAIAGCATTAAPDSKKETHKNEETILEKNDEAISVKDDPHKKPSSIKKADEYAGKYIITDKIFLKVIKKGNRLFVRNEEGGEFEIEKEKEDGFHNKKVNFTINFDRNPKGKIFKLILGMGGRKFPYFRQPEEIHLDDKIMKKYAGKYSSSPYSLVEISYNEGKLFYSKNNGRKLRIFPEKSNRFFFKINNVSIIFVENEKGEVTHFINDNHFRQKKVMRMAESFEREERTAVEFDHTHFEKFSGNYGCPGNLVLAAVKKEGKFFITSSKGTFVEIFPSSANSFFAKSEDITFSFNHEKNQMTVDEEGEKVLCIKKN